MYAMTLSDGTKIEGLTIIHSMIYSDSPITAGMLRGKLSPITIEGESAEGDPPVNLAVLGTHSHMEVVSLTEDNGKYALKLREIPDKDWEWEQIKANQQYIAMMTGVQL